MQAFVIKARCIHINFQKARLFVTTIFDIFHYIESIYINIALWSVFVSSI